MAVIVILAALALSGAAVAVYVKEFDDTGWR
jgi:hypothetical protein